MTSVDLDTHKLAPKLSRLAQQMWEYALLDYSSGMLGSPLIDA